MRIRKILAAFIAFLLLAAGSIGNITQVLAAGDPSVFVAEDTNLIVNPGETNHIKIPIQLSNGYMPEPSIAVTGEAGAPFSFSKASISQNGTAVQGINSSTPVDLVFDVKVKETAGIKGYGVTIKFTYQDYLTDTIKTCELAITLKVQEEKTPAQLTVGDVVLDNTKIGSKTNLSFTVKNEGELTAKSSYLTIDYNKLMDEGYSAKKIKIGEMAPGDTKKFTLPVTILTTATAGRNTLIANFTYKTSDGDALTSAYNFYINLSSNAKAPKLAIDNVKFAEGLKPGDKFDLVVRLKNMGVGIAKDITANIDETSITQDGILKNYFTDGINLSELSKLDSDSVQLPLKVSKYATGGMKNLKVVVNYKDKDGVLYTLNESVYVDVTGTAAAGTPNIVISNVKQSPDSPSAGDNLDISFVIENKSKVDISELKIYADGLTNSTFIPVKSEPYQYIEKLKGGDKVRISMPFIVSKLIPEGLNNLTIKYKYAGSTEDGSVIIPVHNVQNDLGSSSKPKLIISKYTTDIKELKAGSTFNFTYDIYNTNSSVAAKNITVTISQQDNIFSVTQGSSSFFINKINPEETVSNTIELKVKNDATTKAYPLKITIEYEYEGMVTNPETGQSGVTKTEELNLQAVENARPKVDNINIYTWDGNPVTVGMPATLSFEFYNMGKSVLNNVIATLEGDGFTKADGTMQFIGNVQAGESKPIEFDVTPNIEGPAQGVLKISYEDSNGDTVEFTADVKSDVMPAGGMVQPGGVVDGGMPGEVLNPGPIAKAPIIPVWAFVIVEIVIFILFVPVSRKVVISRYKHKLRKKEGEQY